MPPGGHADGIYFDLPDYGPTRRVEVVLVNEDGSSASNKVVAYTGEYPAAGWTEKLTDSSGRATFDVWQSVAYELHISEFPSGDSPHIPAGSAPVSRRLASPLAAVSGTLNAHRSNSEDLFALRV